MESDSKIRIRMVEVKTLEFCVHQVPDTSDRDDIEISFNIRVSFSNLNPQTGVLTVIVSVQYLIEPISKKLGSVAIACDFKIEGHEKLKKEGKYSVPSELYRYIAQNAYSTARGAIAIKGADTIIGSFILPIMGEGDFQSESGFSVESFNSTSE